VATAFLSLGAALAPRAPREVKSGGPHLTSASNPASVPYIRLSKTMEAKGLVVTLFDGLFVLMFSDLSIRPQAGAMSWPGIFDSPLHRHSWSGLGRCYRCF
jgi:hypothetical protein